MVRNKQLSLVPQEATAQGSDRSQGHQSRGTRRLLRVVGAAVYVASMIVFWHILVRVFEFRPQTLPGPIDVSRAMVESRRLLFDAGLITIYESLVGFGLSIVFGLGIAMVVVYSPFVGSLVLPTLVALNATPKVALAPLLILWFGLGVESKIAMAFLLSFFPIVINTVRGFSEVERNILDYFRLMQASALQIFWKVRMPHSLPAIFDGLKIGLPLALIGAIIGEFVAARKGLGYQIILGYINFNTALVFAAVIYLAFISVILFQVLVVLERLMVRWTPSAQKS